MKLATGEFFRKWRKLINLSKLADLSGHNLASLRLKIDGRAKTRDFYLNEAVALAEIFEKDGIYERERVGMEDIRKMKSVKWVGVLREAGLEGKLWKIYDGQEFTDEEERKLGGGVSRIARDLNR